MLSLATGAPENSILATATGVLIAHKLREPLTMDVTVHAGGEMGAHIHGRLAELM